jgi:hypothetical protein
VKLTPNTIEDLVKRVTYFWHGTLTICVLDLKNGALVVGQSNVIDPANYDADVGEDVSYKDALNKIWQLEGYALKTRGA